MRHLALLAVLLGCSAGPSVVVTDPPPLVVEEPAELTIIRQRKPVEAPKPIESVSDAYKLPDHEGDPIVAELPPIPLRPDSWLIWARGVKQGLEVADHLPDAGEMVADANPSETPNACPCGPVCNCGPGCPCENCPHQVDAIDTSPEPVEETPERVLNAIGAEWCGPCLMIHKAAEGLGGIRFLDVDRDTAEVGQLWANERSRFTFMGPHKAPNSLPAFVLTIDGQPVKVWYASGKDRQPWTAERIRFLRDYQVPETVGAAVSSPAAQDAPAPAVSSDGSPAWCVRIHIDTAGSSSNGSGSIVGRERSGAYLVLTNYHVASSAGRIRVKIGGQWCPGVRRSYDQPNDLALVAVACPLDAPALTVAASVSEGDPVEAHGFASGVVYRSQATTFRLDHGQRSDEIDARSCGGESGGPVVNAAGELVGVIYGANVEDDPDGGRGRIVDLASVRAFLTRQGVL